MNNGLRNRPTTILCFFLAGVVGGILDLGITFSLKPDDLWYYHHEYWVSPTYLNFVVASGVGVIAIVLMSIYSMRRGWIRIEPTRNRKVAAAMTLIIAHPVVFWVGSDMRFYPGSLILGAVLLSLSISFVLWMLSGAWSNLVLFLMVVSCLLAPSIASILRVGEPVVFIYPSTLPLISALSGYWLALPSGSRVVREGARTEL